MNPIIKELLKNERLSESKLDIIYEVIEQIPSDNLADFYKFCVLDDVKHLAAFSIIQESDFLRWDAEVQELIINHIAYLIHARGQDFSLVPDFLRSELTILLSFVRVYFDATEREIDIFKQVVQDKGLDKDFDFILSTLKYDDGSISYQIADESIMKRSDYWIEVAKAYYNSPKEVIDYEQMICCIPSDFMNDLSFLLQLISIDPKIILILSEHWKVNTDLCEIVLEKNGLLIEFLPESVKNNPHLAAIALKHNPEAILFISDELTYDVDFIKKVVNTNKKVLEYAIPRMKYLYYNS